MPARTFDESREDEIIQMIEEHWKHRLCVGSSTDASRATMDKVSEFLYLGTSGPRAGLMVAPRLTARVVEKEKGQAKIDKRRREGREEKEKAAQLHGKRK